MGRPSVNKWSSFCAQFPAVVNPQTLEKRYQGILSAILIDFMKVSMGYSTGTRVRGGGHGLGERPKEVGGGEEVGVT